MVATPSVALSERPSARSFGVVDGFGVGAGGFKAEERPEVIEIEAETASKNGMLLGFQLATYMSGLNQNQPKTESAVTGRIAPQAEKFEM